MISSQKRNTQEIDRNINVINRLKTCGIEHLHLKIAPPRNSENVNDKLALEQKINPLTSKIQPPSANPQALNSATMLTNWNLQNSIYLLNDFCADTKTFTLRKLAFLKLKGLRLQVNTERRELTIAMGTDQDYQIIRQQLTPSQRLYQLLGIHFKKVHLAYGLPNEPIEKSILIETLLLTSSTEPTDLRDSNSLGARLRRPLNVALQGHIGALRLHDNDEVEHLRKLWERGRVIQIIEKYEMMHCYDSSIKLVKLWRARHLKEGDGVMIIID